MLCSELDPSLLGRNVFVNFQKADTHHSYTRLFDLRWESKISLQEAHFGECSRDSNPNIVTRVIITPSTPENHLCGAIVKPTDSPRSSLESRPPSQSFEESDSFQDNLQHQGSARARSTPTASHRCSTRPASPTCEESIDALSPSRVHRQGSHHRRGSGPYIRLREHHVSR